MSTRIHIDQLRPGMRIEKLDRSWFATPFFRHRMTVTSGEQIEQLKASGVQTVEIANDAELAGPGETVSGHPQETSEDLGPVVAESPSKADPQTEVLPFEEELPAARVVYAAAKTVIQDAMNDVRMGRDINMDAVNQVVADMADSVLRNPDALTSLSRLKHFDEYTFFHSVNTSLLAISMGRNLGFVGEEIHQLGVGTLLHDIGKTKIPLEILNKPGKYEPHEFEIMKQHALRGAEVLSGTTDLPDCFLKPALEHHERVDGSGYPYQRTGDQLSQFGLISAVVDIYDAITSERCYHKAKPAHEALQFLYLISQKGHLDPRLVQRFIQVVGVYPVGSLVVLNTGELAVVGRLNHETPLTPVVIVVKGPGNVLLSQPETIDLAVQEKNTVRRTIVSVTDRATTGISPGIYLDSERA
ncbi:MAG: HD-GYP domain-containing protein [Nitrospira sp.]|jgi:putative nucleotidyltransferase with HDIG domain|nr:HD-GYP domain-containing protein [Nitrospira sp.]